MESDVPPHLDEPSSAEIREALERVVTSAAIRGSPQLAVFLRFVVEAVLRGEGSRLKGYTIGIEALGRDANFDPQSDPIVRVEASRLRRSIDRYYADAGANDPVIITLPRGSYIPVFSWREAAADEPLPTDWRERVSGIANRRLAAFCVFIALAAVAAIAVFTMRDALFPIETAVVRNAAHAAPPPRGNGLPVIYVEPLRAIGQASEPSLSTASFNERMLDVVARFDMLNVVPGAPPASAFGGRHDYVLSGMIDYGDGRATVALKLIDTAENTVVWSHGFAAADPNPTDSERRIVKSIATALLQPYGVIRSRDYVRQLSSLDVDPRYRCLLEAGIALRGYDAAANRASRGCLERLIDTDPGFEAAMPFLAMIYVREYEFGLGRPAGDPEMLDDAMRVIRKAISMNPMSARAHRVLMAILYFKGDRDAALAAGQKAVDLNPYDMMMVAAYGGQKILAGDVAEGLTLMQQAGEFWEVRPTWQHFYLFLGNYLSGDTRIAAFEASLLAVEPYPLGCAAQVLAAAAIGDTERARSLYDRLLSQYPQWHDARREFGRSITDPAIADRLARDLVAVTPKTTP